ncbi:MAG: hypothetical protein GC165_00640 [Armatimonadetes bacterium]|nr:hypothetical protein [Armatimonadota bacterium]
MLKKIRIGLMAAFAVYLVTFRLVLEPHSEANWATYFLVHNSFLLVLAWCVLMAALHIRAWRFSLGWVGMLCAALVVAGHPSCGSEPEPMGDPLRILTYNVAHFDLDKPGVLKVMRESKADILFVQEACKPEEQKATGEMLCKEMGGYQYVVASSNMIVSRYPIELTKVYDMPTKWPTKKFPEAIVHSPLGPIRVMCVHMEPSWVEKMPPDFGHYAPVVGKVVQDRRAQARIVLEALRGSKEPVIVAGDFNGSAGSEVIRQFGDDFTDVFAATEKGFGMTLLAKMPYKRIDYVWERGLTPMRAEVINSTASDHRPVLAVVER